MGDVLSLWRMKLFIAADHAGFALKDRLKAHLASKDIKAEDLTPIFVEDDDYPLVANRLASHVARRRRPTSGTEGRARDVRQSTMGILFCGSGVGVCIAANRYKGIRAAVGHSSEEVKLAREHNDINVLCLSGWNHKDEILAMKLIDAFLKTKKSTAARHARRVKQLG